MAVLANKLVGVSQNISKQSIILATFVEKYSLKLKGVVFQRCSLKDFYIFPDDSDTLILYFLFNRESPIPLQQLRASCNDYSLDEAIASASAPEIETPIDIPHYIVPDGKFKYAIVAKKGRLKMLKDNTGLLLRVFNPFAPSHLKQNLQKVFTANE